MAKIRAVAVPVQPPASDVPWALALVPLARRPIQAPAGFATDGGEAPDTRPPVCPDGGVGLVPPKSGIKQRRADSPV